MNAMSVVAEPTTWTVADLAQTLGPDMPLSRVRFDPPPGTATERDVEEIHAREDRLFELVDGVLVEKAMGFRESVLALALGSFLKVYLETHPLGVAAAPDGTIRLAPRLVRIPDVAFFLWERFPNRQVPSEPIPDLAPDLAVEVLSRSNTPAEMLRKRQDYFRAGCRLVWEVDPEERTVAVYTDPTTCTTLAQTRTLDGGDVLPGFSLPLARLFAELDPR
jgi:Uma2 family endonuclease